MLLATREPLNVDERRLVEDRLVAWKNEYKLNAIFLLTEVDVALLCQKSPRLLREVFEQASDDGYLDDVEAVFSQETAYIAHAIASLSAAELVAKQWVRTGDAGYGAGSKLKLADVAIDLPCQVEGNRTSGVVQLVLASADSTSSPAAITHQVIIGGPGQGKSTAAQLVAHAFRIGLLRSLTVGLIDERAIEIRDSVERRLIQAGIAPSRQRRWALLFDLAELGAKSNSIGSLLDIIVARVSAVGRPISASELLDWMRFWPIAIILDGLDEVPDTAARDRVLALVAGFISTCKRYGVDFQLVATSRPQGYQNEFEDLFQSRRIDLVHLTETEALAYAEKINGVRNADDPDLALQVTNRLVGAVHERVTQRLMTTPLQVTIMTALAEKSVDLPATRYELFNAYYQTIYDREASKGADFVKLRSHRSHIDYLHERAGLALQQKQEGTASNAVLEEKFVVAILENRLENAGFETGDAASISRELLQLSTERLVMLARPDAGKFGFEVRSLQEYMAARALAERSDEDVLRAIQVLLPSAHWRNTWLLLVGRIFAKRDRLHSAILDVLRTANYEDESGLLLRGSLAAVDLFLDEVAADFPAVRQQLASLAMPLTADYAEEVPSELLTIVSASVEEAQSTSETLAALHRISTRSNANISTLYLETFRRSSRALGMQAMITLADGRKWERGIRKTAAEANFMLAQYLRERASGNDAVIELANILSGELGGRDVSGLPELHVALTPAAARKVLLGLIQDLRLAKPQVAQQGLVLLRRFYGALPRSKDLEVALGSMSRTSWPRRG